MEDIQIVRIAKARVGAVDDGTPSHMAFGVPVRCKEARDPLLERG
jgi:hypothetical protein